MDFIDVFVQGLVWGLIFGVGIPAMFLAGKYFLWILMYPLPSKIKEREESAIRSAEYWASPWRLEITNKGLNEDIDLLKIKIKAAENTINELKRKGE